MNEQEIIETFEFELQIVKLILKNEPWACKFKKLRISIAKNSFAQPNGTINISNKYLSNREYAQLRHTIRCLLTDLITNFRKRDKFVWQRIAKKIGAIKNTKAQDMCECKLCGTITQLVMTELCYTCKKIHDAVLLAPHIAKKVLDSMSS